jgi:quercetin dioxygenase-like cupin family protein
MSSDGLLRSRRSAADLRLVDLAERTGLSVSYLSQVEHNRICPSVVALGRIAQGLGTTVGAIFEDIDETTKTTWAVVRSNERKIVMLPNSPIRNELLVPNLQGALEVMLTKIPPSTKSVIFNHTGDECGYVLTGTLHYWIGEQLVVLNAGDTITHKSNVPHRYENRTRKMVETIWIITPPGF